MRESKSARGTKRRGDLIIGSDWVDIPGVEIIQLPNKKVDVVRGDQVVLLQVIEN